MSFDLSTLEYDMTPEEREASFSAQLDIARKARDGHLTREEAVAELVKMGGHPLLAGNFLMHVLDQKELDAERERTGLIID